MTTMKTIAVTDILVPERLRAVEDDHALAIELATCCVACSISFKLLS